MAYIYYTILQVSVSVDKKILMLFNVNDPEDRMELTFQRFYGHIVSYRWYGTRSYAPAHHETLILSHSSEIFVLKLVLFLCVSLQGTVMGIS